MIAAAAAKSLQSWPTLCDPIDSSPLGSSVPGIFQARTLEWIAISFSNPWKWKVKGKSLSCARLLATPWTAAHQAPPSMGVSRQEYWSGVPLPSPYNFLGVFIHVFSTRWQVSETELYIILLLCSFKCEDKEKRKVSYLNTCWVPTSDFSKCAAYAIPSVLCRNIYCGPT